MALYTSYYGNFRKFPKNCVRVAISRIVPGSMIANGAFDVRVSELAPNTELFFWYMQCKNEGISMDDIIPEYTLRYCQQLQELAENGTLDKILSKLGQKCVQYGTKDVVFLCYEKDDFCHRHILADFINARYKLPVLELEHK